MLLRERDGERVLPIFVRPHEADLLAAGVGAWSQERPTGPDLMAALLKVGGVRVQRVVVERVEDHTFYATVTVSAGGESHELDSRPSDALNLAVRVGAPVFVAAEVIEEGALPADRVEPGEEWRSLSPELMRSLYPGTEAGHFAESAERAMTLAREEARALGHAAVRPEHILLGLLRQQGAAAEVLNSLELTLERARGRLPIGDPEEMLSGFPPYTRETWKVLEQALGEERTQAPHGVGAEHLLLGLVGASEQTLLDLGVEPKRISVRVRHILSARTAEDPASG